MATINNFEITDMDRFIAAFLSQYEYHPKPLVVEKPLTPTAPYTIIIPGDGKGLPVYPTMAFSFRKKTLYDKIQIIIQNNQNSSDIAILATVKKVPNIMPWILLTLGGLSFVSYYFITLLVIFIIMSPAFWFARRLQRELFEKGLSTQIIKKLEKAQQASIAEEQSNTPMRNQQEAKCWLPSESGTTIGTTGSENGKIVLDEEHTDGARITLEQDGHAPWGITCGIYGWFCHTAFASSKEEAYAKYESMKSDIVDMLQEFDEERQIELIDNFVEVH